MKIRTLEGLVVSPAIHADCAIARGAVLDVPAPIAASWIQHGLAVAMNEPLETATAKPMKEAAVTRKKRK